MRPRPVYFGGHDVQEVSLDPVLHGKRRLARCGALLGGPRNRVVSGRGGNRDGGLAFAAAAAERRELDVEVLVLGVAAPDDVVHPVGAVVADPERGRVHPRLGAVAHVGGPLHAGAPGAERRLLRPVVGEEIGEVSPPGWK